MEKFTESLGNALLPLAQKLSENRYLKSISSGFSACLPVVIVGALFTLLANLNIGFYQSLITAVHLKEIFGFVPKITTDMLALYAVYSISRATADSIDMDRQANSIGLLTLAVFLVMIPLGVTGTKDEVTVTVAAALSTSYLGAAGLFTAMIFGLAIPVLYKFFIDKKLVIRMPDSVPPQISISFQGILPSFLILLIFSLIRFGFSLISFGDINTCIYTLLKAPLSALGASPFTMIVLILMCGVMWFFGLHGGMIVMPFINMLYMPLAMENLTAYGAGGELPNIIVKSAWSGYASLGGAGGTLGLCIVMCFMARSQRYKALGKLALPSGLCGINEPITFGLPMVLNTIMLIPLVLTPVITFTLSYIMTLMGVIPVMNGMEIPLGTPVVLSGVLCGGWKLGVWQAVLVLIQVCCYFPFFKVLDNQALKEEREPAE